MTGQQIITIHKLPNISKSKDNEICSVDRIEGIFFKNHAQCEVERLVPDLFLLFIKALYKIKVSGQHLCFNIF